MVLCSNGINYFLAQYKNIDYQGKDQDYFCWDDSKNKFRYLKFY